MNKNSNRLFRFNALALGFATLVCGGATAQELHIKKNVSMGGYVVSSTDTSIKGPRTREVSQTPSGTTVTIRQCDARRTISVNEQAQTYFQQDDPLSATEARVAALAAGTPPPDENSGKIDITTTVTDLGERKPLYGFQARHLKSKVVEESSSNACTQVHQTLEIDGWYADLGKETAACSAIAPPVNEAQGCKDLLVQHTSGSGKAGYPMWQSITMTGPDGKPATVTVSVSELSKQPLEAELFDVPKGYRQVSSMAELRGLPSGNAQAAMQGPGAGPQPQTAQQGMTQTARGGSQPGTPNPMQGMNPLAMMNPLGAASTAMAMQQNANAQMQQQLAMAGRSGMPGMPGMGGNNQPASQQVAAPQALGPKAPGKIRIGIAPPDAQLGQGNNAGADYSTPIRNAIVALMSGPAVEIAALDSHVPIQLQAEAQQKQCDYVLYSSVVVKHGSGGGLGGFMKKAAPLASMAPMAGGLGNGMGGAVAAQAASAAASQAAMSAQQQAMNQLGGFNGQIKSKDDVSVQYQLFSTAQNAASIKNELKGKAKSDGEDVLTPLLQQTANSVLTEVTKK